MTTTTRRAAPATAPRFTATKGMMGKNIETAVSEDGILTITIDLKARHGLSASQKTTIVSTTSGNAEIPGSGGVIMGLNAYVRNT